MKESGGSGWKERIEGGVQGGDTRRIEGERYKDM